MQKQSLDAFEQLVDAFDYASSSWLRLDVASATRDEAIALLAGSCFLFDHYFAKENAGDDLSKAAYEELGASYDPRKLSQAATSIRLAMDAKTLYQKGAPFRDYLVWISQSEPDVKEGLKDDAGLLCFATCDAIVSLLAEQNNEVAPLRLAEVIFLNFTRTFERIYRAHFGETFSDLPSATYFLNVENQFERIRADIED